MKTKKKILTVLAIVGCAILLVAGSIAGTVAYLTATDSVTNTFTVGNVSITLDEAPVDANGKETAGERVKANTYHLVPNGTYDKDPTVTVAANSDECYLFVKVVNPLAGVEGATTIAAQLEANGWDVFDATNGIYVYEAAVVKSANATSIILFETVTIGANVTNDQLKALGSNNQVVITAYAVQTAGFASAEAAWNATFKATVNP